MGRLVAGRTAPAAGFEGKSPLISILLSLRQLAPLAAPRATRLGYDRGVSATAANGGRVMEHAVSWIIPIAVAALYVVWGLSYQARNPQAGGEVGGEP